MMDWILECCIRYGEFQGRDVVSVQDVEERVALYIMFVFQKRNTSWESCPNGIIRQLRSVERNLDVVF